MSLSQSTSIQVSESPSLIPFLQKAGDIAMKNRWTMTTHDNDEQRRMIMDNGQVSKIIPLPLSFSHTRSKGHVVVCDLANNNS